MNNITTHPHTLRKGLTVYGRHEKNTLRIDPLFNQAKTGDYEAASALINKIWTPDHTQALRDLILPDRPPIFMSVPSTSRRNQIPIAFAALLAQKTQNLGSSFVIGDKYVAALHTSMMKSLKKYNRLMCPRIYEPFQKNFFERLQPLAKHTQIILVEDIITTGASVNAFRRFLEHNNCPVEFVVGIKGDTDLTPANHELKKLEKSVHKAGLDNMNIDWMALGQELSKSEIITLSSQYISYIYSNTSEQQKLLMRRQLYYLYALKVCHRNSVISKINKLTHCIQRHKDRNHD